MAEERSGSDKPEEKGEREDSEQSDHQYTELLPRENGQSPDGTDSEHSDQQYTRLLSIESSRVHPTVLSPPFSSSRVTPVLIVSVFAAVFGSSAQFGFNLGVLNNLEKPIRASFAHDHSPLVVSSSFSDLEWAAAAAIFAVGGMLGSLPAGVIADFIGRKWTMMINNGVAVLGICLQSLAVHPCMLIAGRLVIGINAGANTVLAPLYISEVSPIQHRGTMGVCHQLMISIMILISQLLGMEKVLGTPDSDFYGWRVLLAFPLLFVLVQIILLPFCPESPKYLYLRKGKIQEAEKALSRITGSQGYQQELRTIQEEAEESTRHDRSSSVRPIDFILKPYLQRAILISIALHMSQQLTGIGSILLYSTDIFHDAGVANGDIATSVTGLVLLTGTILTIILIERVGRRTLMLYGLGGMVVFFGLISAAFCFQYAFYHDYYKPTLPSVLLVVFTLGITFAFALGPGAIPWLMVGELFQQSARPIAVSISTIINWLGNFTVSFIFPFMLQHLKPYPFVAFIAISGFFWLIMYMFLPETKGKTVDEITQYFKRVTGDSCRFQIFDRTHTPPPIIN